MDFTELIEKRYSVRAYRADPVEEAKLREVLRAAQLAPTAANRQPFRLLVVKTAGLEKDLARVYRAPWFTQATLVLAMCSLPEQAWSRKDGRNYADVDATIAMDHVILAAANLGLGTCWIAAFDPAAAREVLKLPQGCEPLALTPLGYAADEPKPKKRKPVTDLVQYFLP